MKRKKSFKKIVSILLCTLMVLSTVPMSLLASAADGWTYVAGSTSYEPVTVYERQTKMTNGSTYLVDVAGSHYFAKYVTGDSNYTYVLADIVSKSSSEYSADKNGTAMSNDFIVDETGDTYKYVELKWSGTTSSGTLSNPTSGAYFAPYVNGTSRIGTIYPSNPGINWTYNSSNSRLSYQSYYLNFSTSTGYTLTTSTATIYPYLKKTAYKKVASGGGYYKYNGQKDFYVEKGSTFNVNDVRSAVSVLYKTGESATPTTLTINDSAITLSWNQTVNTANEGNYTATVYANGTAIDTITVHVQSSGQSVQQKNADPSTSDLRSKFKGVASDDGKVLTDKTVRSGMDEFGVFSNYADDEFSIALSTLGQSYPKVETVESSTAEKIHQDVVFVIDASGSMRIFNVAGGEEICRGEATAMALNEAIKELYAADPETRIGIVTYNDELHESGIFLPLDKYTLPAGQTDYITWDGIMTAKTSVPSTLTAMTNSTAVLCSGNPGTTGVLLYPELGTYASPSLNDTTVLRYYIDSSGYIWRYPANSNSGTRIGTLADGNVWSDTSTGYTIFRNSSYYFVCKTSEYNEALTEINATLAAAPGTRQGTVGKSYAVKSVSSANTIQVTKGGSTMPGYDTTLKKYTTPNYNNMTKIATVNGVTYYAYYYNYSASGGSYINMLIFSSEYDAPLAVMYFTDADPSYPNIYYDENITIKYHIQYANNAPQYNYISYTTNSYSNTSNGVYLIKERIPYVMATNFLINSSGQVVKPSFYEFMGMHGTNTQAGLQAAEDMFSAVSNKENRVPAVVLISDGIPTIGSSYVNNPPLHLEYSSGKTVGYGTTSEEAYNGLLSDLGSWTVQTALKVKKNVNDMYYDVNGNRNALFYTIGPGVNYIFGQTVLDPTQENLAAAARKTSADTAHPESGIAVPSELARKLNALSTDPDYSDYADWSMSGDMNTEELKDAFSKVIKTITGVARPVSLTTKYGNSGDAYAANAGMIFTDNIGDGMELRGNPIVVYNKTNYSPTSKSSFTNSDGTSGFIYKYNYSVIEPSTGKTFSLYGLTVKVTDNKDGTQTVKWYIPSDLVPVIVHDVDNNTYSYADPIRVVYKVGMASDADMATLYTNSTDDIAKAEFTPEVGNPYYYNNVTGSDGKTHSYLKSNLDNTTTKTQNTTGTDPYSSDVDFDNNGNAAVELGNNGKIQLESTEITVKKVWQDSNNANNTRPSGISIQVYRNGAKYNDPYVIGTGDYTKSKDAAGNDVWTAKITGLPGNANYTYTVDEIPVDGYTSSVIVQGENFVITNTLKKIKVNYELYLVDEDGNPIDMNGNLVSFSNRAVMSDIKEVMQYLGTTVEIDYDELARILPEGYYIYNPDAKFTQIYTSDGTGGVSDRISDSTSTTKIYSPSGATVLSNGTVTGITDYSNIKVAFAIAKVDEEIQLGYDLYLVDENGNPIDLNGNRVSFDNRVVMSDLETITQSVGTSVSIDYDDLERILPEGYYIYNPDATFTQNYTGPSSNGATDTISDTTKTTKVYDPAAAQTGSNGVVTGITDYSKVKVTFAIAKIPDVKVSYDLYLVDENGNPVDENGNRVSFENRVVMSDLETITQSVGSDVEIGYDELEKLLPEGYYIYNPDATFTQNYTDTDEITDKISDPTATTKVYDPSGTSVSGNGTVTGITDHSEVKVTFAIVKIPDVKVGYDLYLVDENGNPIDENGNRVSFENRVVMSDLETITQSVGSDVEIGYDELMEILPEGYYIYNPDATFTQNYTDTDEITDKISDPTATTKVYDPSGTSISGDGTVTGITDHSEVKVTFAIAKITILPDVIVADYGKPIVCSPLDNDMGTKSIIGISAMDSAKPVSEVKTQNGIFKVEGKNVVFYPFKYMSSISRVKYYANVVDSANNTQQLSSTVSVIPATTVYYEDNFGGSEENGGLYIKYTGDWYTVTNSGTLSGDLSAKVDSTETQDRGDVGQEHTPYGYDSSYDGDVRFSDGTAAMVEGSISGTGTSRKYDATASFTFTGTGFDIISRTDLDCGLINVMIYDHDSGELIDSVPVINKGVENLYQIPVISYTGIPYDTYDVVINVSSPIAYLGITGSTFYLDAIRIYDPMGKKSSDNPEFDEANEAYNTDKEANAFIASIRDFIIQVDSLGVEESYGAVYVDTINNDYNAGGVIGNVKAPEFTDEQKRHRSMSEEDLNTFELVGPNEEVYLTPGYGIGFIVETNILPETVQLEIKMPTPAKTASQSVLSVQTYGKSGSQKNFSVKSATEMFYDITDAVQFTKTNGVYRATVILSNGLPSSANENEIVSVTNIKMTYPKNANASNNFGLDAAENGTVNLEQGTPEYAENAEMIALADCGAANVSLKASKELYKQVFDTVYVQRIASTPNYDVVNAEITDSVVSGEYVDVTFNTASFVDNVVLVDENGNEIALTDINCTTDESKRLTDDYLNTKTWTAKARLIADEGEHEYIVKSADETGETEVLTVDVKPAELKKLSVKTAPEKTVYAYGETIDTTGLVLTEKFTDDTEKTVTDGVTFSNTTANRSGRMNITASVDGETAEFTVDVVSLVSANDRTVVDLENKLVYGIEVNSPEIHDYVESIDEKATVACTDAIVGTGSEINLLYGDEVIDTYSAVIFGDVNGDGWYDGTDSIIVNCLANGLLSRAQVGEAVYMAADCNHDGEVDEIDVAILEEAGMLASSIDQTKSTEELVEVCSAFEDYVNLISQSVEPETVITEEETPAPEKTEETTTQAETAETTENAPSKSEQTQSIIQRIFEFIRYIVRIIISYIKIS